MHFVVFATHKEGMNQTRSGLQDDFDVYLHASARHPDVVVHHGGQTLAEDGETVTGLVLVLEAPSLERAREFVSDSPYGRAGIFAEYQVRPWNWLTGRPG